jgi:hypothetical protein
MQHTCHDMMSGFLIMHGTSHTPSLARSTSLQCLHCPSPPVVQGWHNNHHAFPASARHGWEWWQIDPNYLIIRGLEAIGLAWDVYLPTKEQVAAKPRNPSLGLPRPPSSSSHPGYFIPLARDSSMGPFVSGYKEAVGGKDASPLASPGSSSSSIGGAAAHDSDTSGYSGSEDERGEGARAKVE